MKKYVWLIFFFFVLVSCRNHSVPGEILQKNDVIEYASWFDYEEFSDYTKIVVKSPWDSTAYLQTYILVPKNQPLPDSLPSGTLIRTPLERTVCFPSVTCGFLRELGVDSTIVGVAESQYIHIESIQEKIKNGQILDVGQAFNPDSEKLILIQPEAIFANTLQDAGIGQITKTGIPVIECVEYMEFIPLGQSEWLKFIALFFDKKDEADRLFSETKDRYNELKALVGDIKNRPTVFTETMYGNVWYLPGGKSYMAHLLSDAGANYIWKDNENSGSIALSFEQVLLEAEKADYWLIKYYDAKEMSYADLSSQNANYSLFQAYKNRRIQTLNTLKTAYYEELPIHPDIMLSDMISIFHPELLPDYTPVYFQKMSK